MTAIIMKRTINMKHHINTTHKMKKVITITVMISMIK